MLNVFKAVDAGVVEYIDQQMAGRWGSAGYMYHAQFTVEQRCACIPTHPIVEWSAIPKWEVSAGKFRVAREPQWPNLICRKVHRIGSKRSANRAQGEPNH